MNFRRVNPELLLPLCQNIFCLHFRCGVTFAPKQWLLLLFFAGPEKTALLKKIAVSSIRSCTIFSIQYKDRYTEHIILLSFVNDRLEKSVLKKYPCNRASTYIHFPTVAETETSKSKCFLAFISCIMKLNKLFEKFQQTKVYQRSQRWRQLFHSRYWIKDSIFASKNERIALLQLRWEVE